MFILQYCRTWNEGLYPEWEPEWENVADEGCHSMEGAERWKALLEKQDEAFNMNFRYRILEVTNG